MWNRDDYHPMEECFFCKKRPADTQDHEELYRIIRNTTGFPGHVVDYASASIPIPSCSQCSATIRQEDKLLGLIRFIAWAITAGIVVYWVYDPAEAVVSVILSMVLATVLSFVLMFCMATIWRLCSKKTDVIASKGDFPVVKKLLSMGWQCKVPRAIYRERRNEDIDKATIDRAKADYQVAAKAIVKNFLVWCRAEERQNESLQVRPGGAPDG